MTTKKNAKKDSNNAFNFASFHLGLNDNMVCDISKRDFDFGAYSEFKHGGINASKKFARILAQDVLLQFPDFFENYNYDELAIVPFPFKELNTAAGQLCNQLIKYLNLHLTIEGQAPAIILNMYKFPGQASQEHYYPTLNYEERQAILANCDICIDVNRLMKIKKLLIVDDVFVTGASADKVKSYLNAIGYEGEVKFIYISKIDPVTAKETPQIESMLNHYSVKVPLNILDLIKKSDFEWNIRCIKFVLESKTEDFLKFVEQANQSVLFDMYSHCLRMNYASEVNYKTNLRILRQAITQYGFNGV